MAEEVTQSVPKEIAAETLRPRPIGIDIWNFIVEVINRINERQAKAQPKQSAMKCYRISSK
ncbi:MAG TPA: hypothetical protein VF783_21295 [Terriglobales bacterium]